MTFLKFVRVKPLLTYLPRLALLEHNACFKPSKTYRLHCSASILGCINEPNKFPSSRHLLRTWDGSCAFSPPARYIHHNHPQEIKSTVEPLTASQESTGSNAKPLDTLDPTFSDSVAAFKSKTTAELVRGYVVYLLCSINYLVDNNLKIMKVAKTILGAKLFSILMKATVFGHFVAGENKQEITPKLRRMREYGVKPVLDYSAEEDISEEEAQNRELQASTPPTTEAAGSNESQAIGGNMPQYHVEKKFADRRKEVVGARTYFYLNEATCEKNAANFHECLHSVASPEGDGIVAIKMTALGRPQFLLQLSEVIMRARKFVSDFVGGEGTIITRKLPSDELEKRLSNAGIPDTDKFLKSIVRDSEGVIHLFPWSGIIDENLEVNETFSVPSLKAGKMVRLLSKFSQREDEMFRNMIRRLVTLIQEAASLNVCLMIDAEQTYFQPAISRITLELMHKFNRAKPVVWNTYQCYLKNALSECSADLLLADRQKFHFGAKIVRGAYMDPERARAAEMGYPDPICENYDATTAMYESTVQEFFKWNTKYRGAGQPGRVRVMVASHNEKSVLHAIDLMKAAGLQPNDSSVLFAQLYGMCDYITFPLGQAGYHAYKYIPYGPIQEVLPYVSRRAQENRGVLGKTKKEKRLLRNEILRRLIKGQLFYTPRGYK